LFKNQKSKDMSDMVRRFEFDDAGDARGVDLRNQRVGIVSAPQGVDNLVVELNVPSTGKGSVSITVSSEVASLSETDRQVVIYGDTPLAVRHFYSDMDNPYIYTSPQTQLDYTISRAKTVTVDESESSFVAPYLDADTNALVFPSDNDDTAGRHTLYISLPSEWDSEIVGDTQRFVIEFDLLHPAEADGGEQGDTLGVDYAGEHVYIRRRIAPATAGEYEYLANTEGYQRMAIVVNKYESQITFVCPSNETPVDVRSSEFIGDDFRVHNYSSLNGITSAYRARFRSLAVYKLENINALVVRLMTQRNSGLALQRQLSDPPLLLEFTSADDDDDVLSNASDDVSSKAGTSKMTDKTESARAELVSFVTIGLGFVTAVATALAL